MKLVNYEFEGKGRVGLERGDHIFDLVEIANDSDIRKIQTIDDVLATPLLLEKISKLRFGETDHGLVHSLDTVKILSPILHPEKIFLAAINYLSHSKEQNIEPPLEPYFFTKFRNCIIGPGEPIMVPSMSKKVDWEIELAVIIGKKGKYIPTNRAMEYVAGFTIAVDISYRDLQFPPSWSPSKGAPLGLNWVKGKGLDSALPLGPYLVTKDEIQNPNDLGISLSVNGVIRQESRTSEMVFNVEKLVEYISMGITLSPGDIISTGTPLGVAASTGAPFLKSGDIVEGTIEGLGTLRNPVIEEKDRGYEK